MINIGGAILSLLLSFSLLAQPGQAYFIMGKINRDAAVYKRNLDHYRQLEKELDSIK